MSEGRFWKKIEFFATKNGSMIAWDLTNGVGEPFGCLQYQVPNDASYGDGMWSYKGEDEDGCSGARVQVLTPGLRAPTNDVQLKDGLELIKREMDRMISGLQLSSSDLKSYKAVFESGGTAGDESKSADAAKEEMKIEWSSAERASLSKENESTIAWKFVASKNGQKEFDGTIDITTFRDKSSSWSLRSPAFVRLVATTESGYSDPIFKEGVELLTKKLDSIAADSFAADIRSEEVALMKPVLQSAMKEVFQHPLAFVFVDFKEKTPSQMSKPIAGRWINRSNGSWTRSQVGSNGVAVSVEIGKASLWIWRVWSPTSKFGDDPISSGSDLNPDAAKCMADEFAAKYGWSLEEGSESQAISHPSREEIVEATREKIRDAITQGEIKSEKRVIDALVRIATKMRLPLSGNVGSAADKVVEFCEMLHAREGKASVYVPWEDNALQSWSISGMNHYGQNGLKYLYVSMEKGGRCIKAEGLSSLEVFASLKSQAEAIDAES